jgi:hypothetical protein
MTVDSAPRSRRAILVGAFGGLAAVVAGRFAGPDKASAAAGGPVIMGAANTAGVTNTSLATTSAGTALLVTQNGAGTALRGSAVGAGSIAGFFTATNGTGISGVTGNGGSYGVFASNNGPAGAAGALRASGVNNHGVVATTTSDGHNAVQATHTGLLGTAIAASLPAANGVGTAIRGDLAGAGVGVIGTVLGEDSTGVVGHTEGTTGFGAVGVSTSESGPVTGVLGHAHSSAGTGVRGFASATTGTNYGVYGQTESSNGFGVYSDGNAHVAGDLTVSGTINGASAGLKIDHPLDPANQFLSHSGVESPDMMTIHSGIATLDGKGDATVVLPAWFGALNKDFRYQLTAIGTAAPDLHIKSEAKDNRFSIGGGVAGQRVSWQLTGIRQDAWSNAHRVVVEEPKPAPLKGRYLHPKENGQPASKGIAELHAMPAPAIAPVKLASALKLHR